MELWDGYDGQWNQTGVDLVRGEPIPEGLYHLVAEVVVRHTDGTYLVTRRAENLPNASGLWQAGAGGSVYKGEHLLEGARRELREETGIEAGPLSPLYRVRSEEKHALYGGFLCVTDRPKDAVRLQAGETAAYRWLSREELVELVASSDFVPGLRGRLTPCLEGGTL